MYQGGGKKRVHEERVCSGKRIYAFDKKKRERSKSTTTPVIRIMNMQLLEGFLTGRIKNLIRAITC